MDFLAAVNIGVPIDVGERVVVIGGGNVAFDVARTARRYGGTSQPDEPHHNLALDAAVVASRLLRRHVTLLALERYPINVRYPRELRDDVDRLRETLVSTPAGLQVPLGQLAVVDIHDGPPSIKSENARPNAWVYVDLRGIDVGSWVERARQEVTREVELPPGYTVFWSGQYEYMQRAKERLLVIVPITLLLIIVILYLNTKSAIKTAIVLLAVPFSLVGAIWLIYLLGYNWSIAIWVGMIALAGLDAETGVVMLLCVDIAYERWKSEGQLVTYADLAAAIDHGAVQRIRPKMMTVAATLFALVPILWSTGTGADVMRRIAAPMVGGVFSSFAGELFVYPAIFFVWRAITLRRTVLFPADATSEGR